MATFDPLNDAGTEAPVLDSLGPDAVSFRAALHAVKHFLHLQAIFEGRLRLTILGNGFDEVLCLMGEAVLSAQSESRRPPGRHVGVSGFGDHVLVNDPVHFGIIVIILLIGLVTPPVAPTLSVGASIAGVSLDAITAASWRFFISLIVVLLILTFVPAPYTWLPSVLSR